MLALIGGSGLYALNDFNEPRVEQVNSSYGSEPVRVEIYDTPAGQVAFLPRHGKSHNTPPHLVNYRANIDALKQLGVGEIIAFNAVGGIAADMGPGAFAIPDQIIDYTHGRDNTFFEGEQSEVVHIDFSNPFSPGLSERLLLAAKALAQVGEEPRAIQMGAVYGCTQGPRLETAAEIKRMAQDGCDIVGMTAMPEAALAREVEIDYAMLALSVNWAAGIVPGVITMAEIKAVMDEGMSFVHQVVQRLVATKS